MADEHTSSIETSWDPRSDFDPLRGVMVARLGVGTATRDELVAAVASAAVVSITGPVLAAQVDLVLKNDGRFKPVADGFVFLPALVEGIVWVVRVDPQGALEGDLRMDDLPPLGSWWLDDNLPLEDASGARIGEVWSGTVYLEDDDDDDLDDKLEVLKGFRHWMLVSTDGWAAVASVGGALRWWPNARPGQPTERQAAAIRVGFDRAFAAECERLPMFRVPDRDLASIEAVLREAIAFDHDAFTGSAVPPLPVLFAAAGLRYREGLAVRMVPTCRT